MPVTTCTTNAKSNRLPKAAVQRAPPGNGSSSSFSFSRLQPVRDSQKPGDFACVDSALTAFPLTRLHGDRHAFVHADLEILPAYPQPAGADFVLQRIHV